MKKTAYAPDEISMFVRKRKPHNRPRKKTPLPEEDNRNSIVARKKLIIVIEYGKMKETMIAIKGGNYERIRN